MHAAVHVTQSLLTIYCVVTVYVHLQVMAEMHVAFSLLREALQRRRDSQQHDASLTTDATNSSNSSSSSDSSKCDTVTVAQMDPPQLLYTSDGGVVLMWPPAQLLAQVRLFLINMMYHYSYVVSFCQLACA
jgi:hypothetical protein